MMGAPASPEHVIHDDTCEAGDPEFMTSACRCEERNYPDGPGDAPRIHEPGNCVDPAYGNPWCDGIGKWGEDPFAAEIYDDYESVWMCDGDRAGSAADI